MALSERSRQEMYAAFEKQVGKEPALTLLELLPPVGWKDVATKQDLEILEFKMDARFSEMKSLFSEMRSYVDEKIKVAVISLATVNIAVLGVLIAIIGIKR